MKRIYLIWAMCVAAVSAFAVVATPEPVLRQLPDGTWREVYIRGDEHYHYLSTLDGQMIAGTAVGILPSEVSSERQRAPQAVKLTSYVPATGTVRIPVILVNFTDLSFSIDNPVAKFSDLFNGAGGSNPNATGSVHDYFYASSDGALNLVYDVYGPYTLSGTMADYGKNTNNSNTPNARQAVEEAAQLAVDAGVDLSVYDNNWDGYIDNLSVVVAGYNEAEGGSANTIWPHYSIVSSNKTFSGKRLSGYLMISEYRGGRGSIQAGIGTYCHEFGHALGIVDFYDTKESGNYTIGAWDIMCNGSYNNSGCTPPSFTAFERFWMGWLTPQQLTAQGEYTLQPIESHNEAYLLAANTHNLLPSVPSPNEYFLIENRQAIGWDANKDALIAPGILISHITFNNSTWAYNTFNNRHPLGYAIVSAGNAGGTGSTEADVFPGSRNVLQWIPTLNDGQRLIGQRLTNIRQNETDSSLSFTFGVSSSNTIEIPYPAVADTLMSPYDQGIVAYDTLPINVTLRNLQSNSVVLSMSNSNFEFSIDTGRTWIKGTPLSLTIPVQTSYSLRILMRYTPTRQSCQAQSSIFTIQTADLQRAAQYMLYGISPRPVYIDAPYILPATDLASTSFTAHWEPQDDADGYYIALASVAADGTKTEIYSGKDFEVGATTSQAIFTDLNPETTYCFTITAYEEKGCRPNYKPSQEICLTTLSAQGTQRPIVVQREADGTYTITLPESADGSTHLNIYDYTGKLVETMPLPYGTLSTTLHTTRLQAGQLYILRVLGGKLQRKGIVGKLLYQ
ncbi:MAG: M6 family metalloprotease domain-containing protein [Paludibacteraceae bacterium]|nr:M6 family metalloprotease domain-containing protein [Paludibacteraceae bacterium]